MAIYYGNQYVNGFYGTSSFGLGYYGNVEIHYGNSAGGGTDPDAQAFIDATGITGTDADAINTLVLDLKGYNLWTPMIAIYPFVSSSATTQKYNLKDPQDTNAAFRLTFNGTWTHDATGADPGVSPNGWANTHVFPNVQLTGSDNAHMSVYIAENNPGIPGYDMGCYGGGNAIEWAVISSYNNSTAYASMNPLGQGYINYANANTIGHYITNLISGTLYGYKNGVSQVSAARTYATADDNTLSIALAASNRPGNIPTDFSQRKINFATIGLGLSGTEASNLYTAITTYNTAVGR